MQKGKNQQELPHPKRLESIVRCIKLELKHEIDKCDSKVRKGLAAAFGFPNWNSLHATSTAAHQHDAAKKTEKSAKPTPDKQVPVDSATSATLLQVGKDVLSQLKGLLTATMGRIWWPDMPVEHTISPTLRAAAFDCIKESIETLSGLKKASLPCAFMDTIDISLACLEEIADSGQTYPAPIRKAFKHLNHHYHLLDLATGAGTGLIECDNCGFYTRDLDDLCEVEDLSERVTAGEVMPEGECPLCGCLCHSLSRKEHKAAVIVAKDQLRESGMLQVQSEGQLYLPGLLLHDWDPTDTEGHALTCSRCAAAVNYNSPQYDLEVWAPCPVQMAKYGLLEQQCAPAVTEEQASLVARARNILENLGVKANLITPLQSGAVSVMMSSTREAKLLSVALTAAGFNVDPEPDADDLVYILPSTAGTGQRYTKAAAMLAITEAYGSLDFDEVSVQAAARRANSPHFERVTGDTTYCEICGTVARGTCDPVYHPESYLD